MNNGGAPGHVSRDPAEQRDAPFRQCLSDRTHGEYRTFNQSAAVRHAAVTTATREQRTRGTITGQYV